MNFWRLREDISSIKVGDKTLGKVGDNSVKVGDKPLAKVGDNSVKVGDKPLAKVGDSSVGDKLTENQNTIIEYLKENNKISARKLSRKVGISQRKIEENILKLKNKEIIKRIGSPKGGSLGGDFILIL